MPQKRKFHEFNDTHAIDPKTHIDTVIRHAQKLMHHIARETAQRSSVDAIKHASHTCTNSCDVHRVEILHSTRHFNPDRSPLVVVNAGPAWKNATQHNIQTERTLAELCPQPVLNTFACRVSGNLHICTSTHCSAFRCANCVTEDGYLVCPLTGIIHEPIDTFDKGWKADLSSKCTPDTYATNCESMKKQATNSTKLALKLDRTVSLIKNTFLVALSLFPNGEIHTYIKTHLNRNTAIATINRLCKQVRQIRRTLLVTDSTPHAPSGCNPPLLHIADLQRIFQIKTERSHAAFIANNCKLDNHTLSLVAKHYVLQYKIVYNQLLESEATQRSAATLPILGNAAMIDETSTGMPGTRLSARSGRSARTERMTE